MASHGVQVVEHAVVHVGEMGECTVHHGDLLNEAHLVVGGRGRGRGGERAGREDTSHGHRTRE